MIKGFVSLVTVATSGFSFLNSNNFLLTHFKTDSVHLAQYLSRPFATAFSTLPLALLNPSNPYPLSTPLAPLLLPWLHMTSSTWVHRSGDCNYMANCVWRSNHRRDTWSGYQWTWTLWEVCWVLAWSRTAAVCTRVVANSLPVSPSLLLFYLLFIWMTCMKCLLHFTSASWNWSDI